jgi:hypothetical protein
MRDFVARLLEQALPRTCPYEDFLGAGPSASNVRRQPTPAFAMPTVTRRPVRLLDRPR